MKGFNLYQKLKLVNVLRSATIFQLEDLVDMAKTEIERRKRKERKELKKNG